LKLLKGKEKKKKDLQILDMTADEICEELEFMEA
jgi:uncharacterized protein YggU (UPF0235/DUF167 family)